jgi:hypothetical protein
LFFKKKKTLLEENIWERRIQLCTLQFQVDSSTPRYKRN